jgi:hypothetical protein
VNAQDYTITIHESMAWFQYLEWKDAIRKQQKQNTPYALIKGITRFIASHNLDTFQSIVPWAHTKKDILIHSLQYCVAQNMYMNEKVYMIIRQIIQDIGDLNDLENIVFTNLPVWSAKGLRDGTIPYPIHPELAFTNTSFSVNPIILSDPSLRNAVPFKWNWIITFCPIETRELFLDILEKIQSDQLIDILERMIPANMKYITLELLEQYAPLNVIMSQMANPSSLWYTSIDILTLIEHFPNHTPPDIFNIIQHPNITPESLYDICEIYYGGIHKNVINSCRKYNTKLLLELLDVFPRYKQLYLDCDRDAIAISTSSELTIDYVLKHMDIPWDWEELSRNPFVGTPENVSMNTELPWDWGGWGLSKSPALTSEFIEMNFDRLKTTHTGITHGDNSNGLTSNQNLEVNVIENHPEVEWDYGYNGLSKNPNMTLPFFMNNLDKEWDIHLISTCVCLCEETSAKAIQACWRMYKIHKHAKELAKQVEEWWWHPDCHPAMKIRERQFEEHSLQLSS